MEEPTDFPDWEILHCSDAGLPPFTANPLEGGGGGGIESDSDDGPIKSDYFAFCSDKRYSRRRSSDEDSLLAADSDNPTWVEPPNSDSRFVTEPRNGELGSAGIGSPRADPGGDLWTSDESSSDGQASPPLLSDHDEGGAGCCEGSNFEAACLEGVDGTVGVNESAEVGSGEIGGIEEGRENSDELVFGDAVPEAPEETSTGSHDKVSVVEGEKAVTVLWKLPLEILNFCVLRVRPVWSISIAAVVVGFVMLGRRLYRMKRKTRSLPIKVTMDDKKVSQFAVRAARLSEAFSVVKRVPMIKSSLPAATGVTPWPVMALR